MINNNFRVMSWNVNSIHARLERLEDFLKREQPDILCLQELKCDDLKFPLAACTEWGYHAYFYGQKSYNGVAILSKREASTVHKGFGPHILDPMGSRVIWGQFGDLNVLNLYVPNGREVGCEVFGAKLVWLKQLKEFILTHGLDKKSTCIVGDFNITPEDIDSCDPIGKKNALFHTPEERSALKEILNLGFHDVFRKLYPTEQSFTWWDYRDLSFVKNKGLRIDLILTSETLTSQCSHVVIHRNERKGTKPSDHVPVEVLIPITETTCG